MFIAKKLNLILLNSNDDIIRFKLYESSIGQCYFGHCFYSEIFKHRNKTISTGSHLKAEIAINIYRHICFDHQPKNTFINLKSAKFDC